MALELIPFTGGSEPGISPYADVESSINLFPAIVESAPGGMSAGTTVPGKMVLLGTPGLSAAMPLPWAPRALFVTGDGRLFAVLGQYFYEIFTGILARNFGRPDWSAISGSPFTNMVGFGPTLLIVDDAIYSVASVVDAEELSITPVSITGATNAAAAVLSTFGPVLPTGSSVEITGFTGGWSAANGTFTVTVVSGSSFSIPVNSTGFGPLAGTPVFTPVIPDGTSYWGYCQRNGSYTFSNKTTPATICHNGTQFLIVEDENVYLDANDGNGPVPSVYQNGSGTVATSGTAVAWRSGSQFDESNLTPGNLILISGAYYSTAAVPGATSLTLTAVDMVGVSAFNPTICFLTFAGAPPAPETGATITVSGFTGGWAAANGTYTCTRESPNSFTIPLDSSGFGLPTGGVYTPGVQDTAYTGTVTTSGTAVTWASGSTFDAALSAAVASWAQTSNVVTITINSVAYSIASVTDIHDLVLTSSAGTQSSPVAFSISLGVAYAATYPVTASSAAFLDGYFVVAKPNSAQINISAINNGLLWNPIDNALKAGWPDNIVSIAADHETLYLIGAQTAEAWQDSGAAAFPFQRNSGGFIPHGCIAPNSVAQFGEGIAWLSGDARGQGRMVYAVGFLPQAISTPSVEYQWSQYSTLADAISYSYQEMGFTFLVVTFPTGNATWVYELSTQRWHQRMSGTDRQAQMFHAFAFGAHIVAGLPSIFLNVMSMNTYSEDLTGSSPQLITRRRTFRVPNGNAGEWSYFDAFRLIAENPAGTPIAVISATNANPCVLTIAGIGLGKTSTQQSLSLSGFTGNWAAANGAWIATVASGTTFAIPLDSSGFGAMAGAPELTLNLSPMLLYSKDGGETFLRVGPANPPLASAAFGAWDWRRLGRSRDRVFRVEISAPLKVALLAAAVEVS